MKNGWLLSCIIAILLTMLKESSSTSSYYDYVNECLEKHHISLNDLLILMDPKSSQYTLDRRFKCAVHCIMDHMHYFDYEGHVNILRIMHQEVMEIDYFTMVDACRSEFFELPDECEMGYQTLRCIRNLRDKNVFDIPPGYSYTGSNDSSLLD